MSSTEPLSGRTAVVTGASSGIGRESSRALAEAGADVVLAARREERLNEVADQIESSGGDATVVPTDVTDEDQVDALIDSTIETYGSLDVLFLNAGLARGSAVEDLTTKEYRQMMAVNTDGVFFTTRAALPSLLDAEGNLIVTGSFAGQYPRPFNPVYAATKWWVRGFAKSVMAEVGEEGVGVTIINPSEVRTEFGSEDGSPFKEAFEPGEVTEPEEIAEAVVFAATRDHSTVSELDLYRRDKFSFF
ncbi:MAG: SDR family oxidoreductase [Halodesulfurarchaeum sp.]